MCDFDTKIVFFCKSKLLSNNSLNTRKLAQPAGRILFNSDFEIPVLTPASPSPPR